MSRPAAQRLKLGEHHRQFVRRVLRVEQNPVESGVREDFGDDVTRQAVPQADLQSAGLERLLERVVEFVHLRKPGTGAGVSYTAGRRCAALSTARSSSALI